MGHALRGVAFCVRRRVRLAHREDGAERDRLVTAANAPYVYFLMSRGNVMSTEPFIKRSVIATKGLDTKLVLLDCGHERWLPFDWDGGSLQCRECEAGALPRW